MRYLLLLIVVVLSACSTVTENVPQEPAILPGLELPVLSYDKAVYTQADMLPGSANLSAACPGQQFIYKQVVRIHQTSIVHIQLNVKLIGGPNGDDPLDRDQKVTLVDTFHGLVKGTINRPTRRLTIPALPAGDYWLVGIAQGISYPYTKAATYRIEFVVPEGCPVA